MRPYPKICIVGLKCYGLLSHAATPQYIGGIENQLVLLARGLADGGFPVSFVTFDHGQPDGTVFDGIRIIKAFGSDEGIPVVRFAHPRWTGLCAALHRADADIYYQMGAGCEAGQVARWCQRRRRRFVFATASDGDCLRHLPALRGWRERYLYRYGLKRADTIISQTRRQRELLLTHYGRPSEVIRAFTQPRPAAASSARAIPPGRGRILWIGRICPAKRPHLLLEVSRRLPEYTFDLIGDANADNEYVRNFRREAGKNPSLVLHGRVSHEFRDQMYDEARLLISTSEMEGFPVVFVEAWSRGIPVLSTFDPDGLIAEYGLGWHRSGVAEFVEALRMALNEPQAWRTASEAARAYYENHHSADVVVSQFEQLLLHLAADENPAA